MATLPQDPAVPNVRRLLLIDFDWRDADWLSELFRSPGVSVRLVVGEGPQDPGVRLADMCGLPRTVDLADLTREIFDLALVGERSSRRTQLESLLVALGTPCVTPDEFLRGGSTSGEGSRPGVEASLALHAAALEQSLAGSVDALLDEALAMARTMTRYSHHGLEATKQSLWVEQEISSLAAAIEFEDRNQLMAGFTDNLPEAIRAFDQGREPVYLDEPRKDLFDGG